MKERIFIVVFLAIIVLSFLSMSFLWDTEFLYYENRTVSRKPEIDRESVLSGQYFDELENYITDNFRGRTQILKAETWLDMKLIKRPVVHDLYLAEDNILPVLYRNQDEYSKALSAIDGMGRGYGELSDSLRDRGALFLYVGIPEHSSIFAEEYPDGMLNKGEMWLDIEEKFFNSLDENGVLNLRARDFLSKNPRKFYTRTDHHFSYYGAVETYNNIIELLNSSLGCDLVYDDLELIKLGKAFKGSYSRKLFNLDKFEDESLIYREDFEYTRRDKGNRVEDRIFHLDEIDEDGYLGYEMYMGGDIPWTEIRTNREELPNILVYGDSFTNPLETLLLRNANNLWSVDFRHYKDGGLLEIVEELKPDVVICIRDNLSYVKTEDNGILK